MRSRSIVLACVGLMLFIIAASANTARGQCHSAVEISEFKVVHKKASGDENVATGYAKTNLGVDFHLVWNSDDHTGEDHEVTITYTYGDGSTGSSSTHVYTTGGTKNASVTVSCTCNGDTKSDTKAGVTIHVITDIEITHVGGEAVGDNPRMSFNDACAAAGRVLPAGTPGSELIDWIIAVTGQGEARAFAKNGAMKNVTLPDASFAESNVEWISTKTLYASIDGDWSSLVTGFDEDEELLHGAVAYISTSLGGIKAFYDGDGTQSAGTPPNWFKYYKSNAGGGDYNWTSGSSSYATSGGGTSTVYIANNAYTGNWYWTHDYTNPGNRLKMIGQSGTNKYYAHFLGVLAHETQHATNQINTGPPNDDDSDRLADTFETGTSKTDPNDADSAEGGSDLGYEDREYYANGPVEKAGIDGANTDNDRSHPGTNWN